MSRLALATMVALILLLGPTASAAELSATDRLARARVCYAALDYECAAAELAEARAGIDGLPFDAQLEAWRLSAEVALATERAGEATQHLHALLERRPAFAPPKGAWPEPWLAVLEEARRTAPDREPPTVAVASPRSVPAGVVATVVAKIDDRSGVARATLYVAVEQGPPAALAMVTSDGVSWRGTIPAELVRVPSLALWVEAWDRASNGPGTWGHVTAPRALPVTPPVAADTLDFYETWWFWSAVGVAVVGGGVAIGILASGTDDSDGPSKPEVGDVRFIPEFPQ